MNKAETIIAKRMFAELELHAKFAVTNRVRVVTLARRDAVRELTERFERHANRIKHRRRLLNENKSKSSAERKRKPKPKRTDE